MLAEGASRGCISIFPHRVAKLTDLARSATSRCPSAARRRRPRRHRPSAARCSSALASLDALGDEVRRRSAPSRRRAGRVDAAAALVPLAQPPRRGRSRRLPRPRLTVDELRQEPLGVPQDDRRRDDPRCGVSNAPRPGTVSSLHEQEAEDRGQKRLWAAPGLLDANGTRSGVDVPADLKLQSTQPPPTAAASRPTTSTARSTVPPSACSLHGVVDAQQARDGQFGSPAGAWLLVRRWRSRRSRPAGGVVVPVGQVAATRISGSCRRGRGI